MRGIYVCRNESPPGERQALEGLAFGRSGDMRRAASQGAIVALAISIPVMAVCALTIGIPVPMGGWMRGPEWARRSAEVLFFLSLFWAGLPLLGAAALGAASGALAHNITASLERPWLTYTIMFLFAALAEFLAVFALSFFRF